MLTSERRFQRTEEHDVRIGYAKIMEGQKILGEGSEIISSNKDILIFGDVYRMMMAVLGKVWFWIPTLYSTIYSIVDHYTN